MSRMSVCALAAVLAIGSFISITDAWARGPGGHVSRSPGGHVRSFSAAPRFSAGPRFSGVRTFSGVRNFGVYSGYPRRYGLNRRFIGPYVYLGYNSCYRWRTVWTAYGPRMVRVNVCGYPYAYRAPFVY